MLLKYMVIDTIRTIKLLGKWSANRFIGKKRPLIAVFSLTHYCNFYCPMCPFGDSDKINQFKFAKKMTFQLYNGKVFLIKYQNIVSGLL